MWFTAAKRIQRSTFTKGRSYHHMNASHVNPFKLDNSWVFLCVDLLLRIAILYNIDGLTKA
jgi:hypothetical protein